MLKLHRPPVDFQPQEVSDRAATNPHGHLKVYMACDYEGGQLMELDYIYQIL